MADLTRHWQILRRRVWLIGLCVLMAGLSGWGFTVTQPPHYEATTSLLINPAAPNPSIAFLDRSVPSNGDGLVQLTASYTAYLKSRTFTQRAVEKLGIAASAGALAQAITTSRTANTNIFEISVTWDSAAEAQRIANGIANMFIAEHQQPTGTGRDEQGQALQYYKQQVTDLRAQLTEVQDSETLTPAEKQTAVQRIQAQLVPLEDVYVKWSQAAATNQIATQSQTVTASVLDSAALPGGPSPFSLWSRVLFAALAGLVLGGGLAFGLDYLDDTVKRPEDATRITGLPSLGNIVRLSDMDGEQANLIVHRSLTAPEVEAYRMLRTNIQFATMDQPAKAILVTSPGPQDGKTTTLGNLAIIMARAGSRVIAVDTDLRRPSLHRLFGLPNTLGFTNVLLSESLAFEETLQATEVENLRVLTSGPLPPNPAELLGSPRFQAVLEQLKAAADVVLFDSPPVSAVADPVVLAGRLGSALIVVDAGRTRSNVLAAMQSRLAVSGSRLLGTILNKSTPAASSYYYQYYYYRYHAAPHANGHNGNGTMPKRADDQLAELGRPAGQRGVLGRALGAIRWRR